MINETHAKGRVVKAALDLAAAHNWADVTLRDIADRAGVGLADLRRDFSGKAAILAEFMRQVDDAVLAKAPARDDGQPARDRIFDVLMTRLEVLEPYKAALRSLSRAPAARVQLAPHALSSQAWMLHAAGINADGPVGAARVAGVASVYASVLRTWLDETDQGYPKTMAELDRRLKRGESVLRSVDDACAFVGRLAGAFRKPKRAPAAPEADAHAAAAPPPEVTT